MKWMDENDPDSCRCRAICLRPRDMKIENPFASTQFGICYNDKRRGCERRGRMGDDTATTTTEKSGCSATISNLWICVGAVLMMVINIWYVTINVHRPISSFDDILWISSGHPNHHMTKWQMIFLGHPAPSILMILIHQ